MTPRQTITPDDPSHPEIQALLPWYANRTLTSDEAARVATHLSACPHCRDELEQCRILADTVKDADENTWTPPITHFTELMRRVDAVQALAAKPPGLTTRVQGWFTWLSAIPPSARWFLGTQGAVIMVLGISLAWLLVPTGGNVYETMSSAPPRVVSEQTVLKIVFADDITGAELRDLLQKLNANVVAGPSALGVYTVQVPGRTNSPSAVLTLRAHPKVQLVEEIRP